MEKKEEYVVCEDKSFYLIFIIICVGAIYSGYWAFTLSPDDSLFEHRDVYFVRVVAIAVILMFSIFLIIYIKSYISLRKNSRILVLTEKGIECNNPGMEYIGWIGWEEITDIAVEKNGKYTYVLNVHFVNKNREFEKTREKRIKTIFKEKNGIHLASVPLLGTDRDKNEIKEKVEEYWIKYGKGSEPVKETAYEMIEKPQTEEREKTETGLKEGVLKAASFKKQEELKKIIEIRRKGETFFEFMIHPLEQKEVEEITSQSDICKIYLATVDREKIWDNAEIQRELESQGYTISSGMDVIGAVLEESEIKEINVQIDKISGFYDSKISELKENR